MNLLIFWIFTFYYVILVPFQKGDCSPESQQNCPCNHVQHSRNSHALPPKTTDCTVSNTPLLNLTIKEFVGCMKDVKALSFINTSTRWIENGFFVNFTKLKKLEFINNTKVSQCLKNLTGIDKTKLEDLTLNNISLNDENLKDIYAIFPSTLKSLTLRSNHITTFPLNWIQGLKNLTSLDLSQSIQFRHFISDKVREPLALTDLLVTGTSFFWTKLFKNSNSTCILPNLTNFHLSSTFVNVSATNVEDNCLSNLKLLDLDHCIFEDGLYNDSFRFLPNLQKLNISESFNIYQLPILNTSLQELRMNNVQMKFDETKDHLHIFRNLENLQHLEISHINLGTWSDDSIGTLLDSLTNLQCINASNNNLKFLPSVFLKLHNLTTVILTNNSIPQWHQPAFQSKNLESLNLENNAIEYLNTDFLPTSIRILNLKGNPFRCTCDLVPFIIWAKQNNLYSDILKNRTRYVCDFPMDRKNKSLADFNPLPTDCRPFNKVVITAMVLCGLMVIVVCVTDIVVCYRERREMAKRKPRYKKLSPVT